MSTVKLVIDSAEKFYDELKKDPDGRYLSWEYCYKNFHDARNNPLADVDYLALQLAFYLASWGMYRGSSFLLQKDYKIHIPAIEEILKKEYDVLFGIDCAELEKEENQNLLREISEWLKKYYYKIRENVRKTNNNISDTLITKILMGTLGCVPAYDRYFIAGIKEKNVTTGNYNIESIKKLAKFYHDNAEKLEPVRKKMKIYYVPYPQMKILDMGFWQIGFDLDRK